MLKQLITVDMEATTEVNIMVEHAERELKAMREALEAMEDGDFGRMGNLTDKDKTRIKTELVESIAGGVEELEDIKSSVGPRLTLRYIPAAKLSSLGPTVDSEFADLLEAARKVCALGVSDWAEVFGPDEQPAPFDTEIMLDTMERAGMLFTVAACVREYNTLSEETGKKS